MTLATPAWSTLFVFGLASLVLAATPGPGVLYIVTRTLAQGRRAGLASVVGVALGNLGNALAASLGLGVVLAVSAHAFTVVKLAGALYLIYLGIRALRTRSAPTEGTLTATPPVQRILRDGFVVALLNPKTALFFASFLPQFIDATSSVVLQSTLFGSAFVAIAACTDTVYVLAAGLVAPVLASVRGRGAFARYVTAAVYIGLGIFTATLKSPSPK